MGLTLWVTHGAQMENRAIRNPMGLTIWVTYGAQMENRAIRNPMGLTLWVTPMGLTRRSKQ